MDTLNQLGRRFSVALGQARVWLNEKKEAEKTAEKVHVVGAGSVITAAYEQLRNAAEYTEEHLLLRKAINRYFTRAFLTRSPEAISQSGDELITELTYAGYLKNDSISETALRMINTLASEYHAAYQHVQAQRRVSSAKSDAWTVEVLSAEVAGVLRETRVKDVFAQFAFDYYKQQEAPTKLFDSDAPQDFDPALYVAVHRSLLKSDDPIIRNALLHRYGASPKHLDAYVSVNQQLDELFSSKTTEKLAHYADRQGAPLRIINRMLEEYPDMSQLLTKKSRFLSSFEGQVQSEYTSISRRVTRGIVKSVVFLIITKFLVGIAIEVPYDIAVHGAVLWTPLLFNLFFPPVYMVLLRTTLALPSPANTKRLKKQAESMLYGEQTRQLTRTKASFGTVYNVFYVLFFLGVFAGVSWLLVKFLHFEIPHLVVFYIFFSGASFLGFRLSRMIRELESVDSQQNSLTVVRDFLYMPFVVVGRWISEKYSKVNFVAMTLDMLIELPLKTVLRAIRQWSAFISSKKDQL